MMFGGFMFVYALVAQAAAGMGPMAIGASLLAFAGAFLAASLYGTRFALTHSLPLLRTGAASAASSYPGPLPMTVTVGLISATLALLAGLVGRLPARCCAASATGRPPTDLTGAGRDIS